MKYYAILLAVEADVFRKSLFFSEFVVYYKYPQERSNTMEQRKSLLIKDTTRAEREQIVHQALWGSCGVDCEFCSGCDNRGGGRIESIYQPYIDGLKELREINAEYNAPFVR